MNENLLTNWLDAYRHCYENADPARLVTLFTDDATYQEHPYMELVHARDFHEFWSYVVNNAAQRHIDFRVFCVNETQAVVNWTATAVRIATGEHREGDGVFHLTFDSEHRCSRLREWQSWHIVDTALEPGWPNKRTQELPLEHDKDCKFCRQREDLTVAEYGSVWAHEDIYPVSEGHHLIIPKRHTQDLFSMTETERHDADALIRRLREKLIARDHSIKGFNVGMNCGAESGQSIFHAHWHLIPRRKGDSKAKKGGVRGVIPEKMVY